MTRRRSTCVRGGLGLVLLAAMLAPASASAADAVLCNAVEATIVGTDGPDVLVGRPGFDVIAGLGGDDRISGDLGADVVCGGDGDDSIVSAVELIAFGGPGDDHLELTAGEEERSNEAELYGDDGNDTIVSAVALTAVGGPGNDHLEVTDTQGGGFFKRADLYGDDGDDVLIAGSIISNLFGGDGDDRLLGGPSTYDPLMYPGPGRDVVDGGGGEDTVVFDQDGGPVHVDLARGFARGQGRDTITDIDNIWGTPYADRMIGDDNPNTIRSGLAPGVEIDVVHGRGGDDQLSACAGTLLGGGRGDDEVALTGCGRETDDDQFDGGSGYDWLTFENQGDPVSVDLGAGTANGPAVGSVAVSRFEAVQGGNGADTLRGDASNNSLKGGIGDDLLDGRGGNDFLQGVSDNDTLFGGQGDDDLDGGIDTNTLNGGPGTDTCSRGAATNCER